MKSNSKRGLQNSLISSSSFLVTAILITLASTPFLVSCKQVRPKQVLSKPVESNSLAVTTTTGIKTPAATSTSEKTPADIAREEGMSFSEQSEAMDYFYDTFFSGNFEAAINMTTIKYRKKRPRKQIIDSWKIFYDETISRGYNFDNLWYRSNLGGKYENTGIIKTPSGKIIID